MFRKRYKRYLLWLLLIAIATVVLGLAQVGVIKFEEATATPQAVVETTPVAVSAVPETATEESTLIADTTRNIILLAWIGQGLASGQPDTSAPGQIVFLNQSGETSIVLNLPQGTSRVEPCSEQAASPDGNFFAFFIGGESGALYTLDNTYTLREVNPSVSATACAGMGAFQYSPDSARLGYINFPSDAITGSVPAGWLHVQNTADAEEHIHEEEVAAFDLADDALAFVSVYTNPQGEADEAAIFHHKDGATTEVSTLVGTEGCLFHSAAITLAGNDRIYVVMGQRCNQTGWGWTLYVVDAVNFTANQVMSDTFNGQYFPDTRTNTLTLSPDGALAYLTYPDGLTRFTTHMQRISLASFVADDPPFPVSNIEMPRYNARPTYDAPDDNVRPVFSPDGNWLAVVTRNANNESALNLIELGTPDLPPLVIEAGARGDTISSMAFTPDSRQLLFVSGGHDKNNNRLNVLDLATETQIPGPRGRFARQMAVSPDGRAAALADWRVSETPDQPDSLDVVVFDLETQQKTPLFNSADILDGQNTDRRFVYLLAWRR